ncbi:MAG: GNAT family N-acetyltransferase [Candidatus Thorarchaeota archaeon]
MELLIKPLSPEILDDWVYFFEEIGFADNPAWSGCFCRFYHFPGSIQEWETQSKDDNKKASIDLIRRGKMHGFLAYSDKKPVGWCNVNSRENYAKELYEDDSPDSINKKIAGIVCFLIAHTERRQGISRNLLKHTIAYYKKMEYDIIESYPRTGNLSDAHSYRGPVSLYESEGFTIHKEFENFLIMRKELK